MKKSTLLPFFLTLTVVFTGSHPSFAGLEEEEIAEESEMEGPEEDEIALGDLFEDFCFDQIASYKCDPASIGERGSAERQAWCMANTSGLDRIKCRFGGTNAIQDACEEKVAETCENAATTIEHLIDILDPTLGAIIDAIDIGLNIDFPEEVGDEEEEAGESEAEDAGE